MLSLEENEFRIGNRTRVEIIASMLNAARDRTLKTHIMYRANVSHRQLERYLSFLLESGLLENVQNVTRSTNLYQVTEKGRDFLRDYSRLSAHLKGSVPWGSLRF